jgi:exopolysaccharide biosynthesis polyprenyl glycosylphosphotransferase
VTELGGPMHELAAPATVTPAGELEATAILDDRTLGLLERKPRARRRGWLVHRVLLGADVLGLLSAFLVAQLIFADEAPSDRIAPAAELVLFLATLPVWIVVAKLYGLYDRDEERTDHTTADDLVSVFHVVTVGCWLLFSVGWLSGMARPNVAKLFLFWGLAILLVTIGRAAARGICRRQSAYMQNTVIVGAGDVGQVVARKLLQHPEYGINLVGFVDSQPRERRDDLEHLTVLGSPDELLEIIDRLDVERVIVAFSGERHEHTLELIRSLKSRWVQIDIVPRLFELVAPGVGIHTVEGLPLVSLPPFKLSRSSRVLKRAMDVTFSTLGLVLLAPILALLALMIKLDSKGPVFFRQVRMGAADQTFRIFKFRTMTADADERKSEVAHLNRHAKPGGDPRMFKISGDPRVTRVGRFLRRYSLDELPQLLNVLKGEMSLVGPRPLILDEDRHIEDWGRKRLDLKPGMTGLWQVLGRSGIPFDEMVKLDYIYVTTWSLGHDLLLLLRTVPSVLRPDRTEAATSPSTAPTL